MGEYAIRKDNNQAVKIGTCEDMLYLRFEDRHRIKRLRGNLDPARDPKGLRFRVPFPDEDGQGPGFGEPFRTLLLVDFTGLDEESLGTGTMQMHHPSGLLLNVTCHHGRQLPEGSAGVQPHWNGRRVHWFALSSIKACADSRLRPVVQCSVCRNAWALDDWAPVLASVPEQMRERLTAYSREVLT